MADWAVVVAGDQHHGWLGNAITVWPERDELFERAAFARVLDGDEACIDFFVEGGGAIIGGDSDVSEFVVPNIFADPSLHN